MDKVGVILHSGAIDPPAIHQNLQPNLLERADCDLRIILWNHATPRIRDVMRYEPSHLEILPSHLFVQEYPQCLRSPIWDAYTLEYTVNRYREELVKYDTMCAVHTWVRFQQPVQLAELDPYYIWVKQGHPHATDPGFVYTETRQFMNIFGEWFEWLHTLDSTFWINDNADRYFTEYLGETGWLSRVRQSPNIVY